MEAILENCRKENTEFRHIMQGTLQVVKKHCALSGESKMDYLDILQKINDLLFAFLGDNRITIDFQVYINEKRFINDKVDVKNLIDGEFVQ